MSGESEVRGFASDNHAGAHPEVLAAIAEPMPAPSMTNMCGVTVAA